MAVAAAVKTTAAEPPHRQPLSLLPTCMHWLPRLLAAPWRAGQGRTGRFATRASPREACCQRRRSDGSRKARRGNVPGQCAWQAPTSSKPMWHSLAVPRAPSAALPAPHRDCQIASDRAPGRAAPSIEQAQRAAATGSPGPQLAQGTPPAAMAALQRLSSCVGLGLGTPRIVAAAAASSSSLWLRAYSGDAAGGSDKPADAEAAPAAEAAAADVPAAAEEPAAEVHPALIGAQAGMVRCRAPAHLHGQLYAAAVCLHAPHFHQPCVLALRRSHARLSLPLSSVRRC